MSKGTQFTAGVGQKKVATLLSEEDVVFVVWL